MLSLDAVRRPEYTGDRRCWPCTVGNGAILVGASAAVARRSRLAALALLAVGAAGIALRGYLVPYTPRVAPLIAERLPVAIHDDRGGSDSLGPAETGSQRAPDRDRPADDAPETDPEDVLGALAAAGVVRPDGETLYLADAFREDWLAEAAALRELDDAALAAAVADAAPRASGARIDRSRSRRTVVVEADTGRVADERRLSYPVALAEAGAVRALAGRVDDPSLRAAAAEPLRALLDTCPACEGPVEETTARECCGAPANPRGPDDVLACADCGERLYTF